MNKILKILPAFTVPAALYTFIRRCPANPAQPRKFRQIERPVLIRRVMPREILRVYRQASDPRRLNHPDSACGDPLFMLNF